MKGLYLTISILLGVTMWSYAQHFQFSQYNFTPQRINPAQVGSADYAAMSFLYRNQSTGGGFNLNSNILNASYPLFNRRQQRWSGVGVSFMDDRAGQSGIFVTQEVSASWAVHVPLAKWQSLSLGVNVLHSSRKLDLAGFYTGSQYIEDRGFDGGIGSGEPLDGLRNKYTTFSSGLYWQQLDKAGSKLASFGFSFFDINRPDESFMGEESARAATYVITGSFAAYSQDRLSVFPEFLFTRNAGRNVLNGGVVTRYALNQYRNKPSDYLDIITKYVVGRSGIIGLQFHRENISFGASYDVPVSKRAANAGAFEIGLELRRLVDPRMRVRKRNEKEKVKAAAQKQANVRTATVVTKKPEQKPDTTSITKSPPRTENAMSERLRHKQDSVQALASHGQLSHEPFVLEETTLRFGFDFGQAELDKSSQDYLDELARALNDNPALEVELTGHTDNIGSHKFNMRLSLDRANTLKDELVKRGVDETRIAVYGRGETEPLNENVTEQERAENRRVEMKILYPN